MSKELIKLLFVDQRDQTIQLLLISKEVPELFTKYPEILAELTFDELCRLANAPAIIPLLKYGYLQKCIDSQIKFLRLCCIYNINLTLELLKDEQIKKMMIPVLKDFKNQYHYYNFHESKKEIKHISTKFPTDALLTMQLSPEDLEQKELLEIFPTIKEYADYLVKRFYDKGDFTSQFHTHASDEKHCSFLGAAFTSQIYHVRSKLLDEKIIHPTDKFNFLECGAGNGYLCKKILANIKKMAELDKAWAELYDFQYHIIERSAELIKLQQKNTAEFAEKININKGMQKISKESLGKRNFHLSVNMNLLIPLCLM